MAGLQAKWLRVTALFGVLLALASGSHSSFGAEVKGLYDALIPVADQSEKARNQAIRKGFVQVLTKLSGSTDVANSAPARQALSRVSSFVSGYSYQKLPATTPSSADTLAVAVTFSPQVVNRFLRSNRLSIWPADREPLLVWLVLDDADQGRQLVGVEAFPDGVQVIEDIASQRGLPVVFPVLDLQDRLTLRPDDAWGFNEEQLAAAAQRYQAKNWLVIRLFKTSHGQWRGSSWLSQGGDTRLINYNGDDLPSFMSGMMHDAVNRYASAYVYVPQAFGRRLPLMVEGVGSYRAYKAFRNYLDDLEIISHWELQSLSGDRLELSVSVEGDPAILYASLNRDRRIRQLDAEGHYRWLVGGQ